MSKSRWSRTPPLLLRAPERPYHPRKGFEDGAVRCDEVEVGGEPPRPGGGVLRRGPAGQVAEYPAQEFGIEDLRRLREASEGRALHAELPPELLEVGEPPEVAEARDRRVEEVEKEERGVLVVVELAVRAVVMLMQVREEPANALQILPAHKLTDVVFGLDCRARHVLGVYARAATRTVKFEKSREKHRPAHSGRVYSRQQSCRTVVGHSGIAQSR